MLKSDTRPVKPVNNPGEPYPVSHSFTKGARILGGGGPAPLAVLARFTGTVVRPRHFFQQSTRARKFPRPGSFRGLEVSGAWKFPGLISSETACGTYGLGVWALPSKSWYAVA